MNVTPKMVSIRVVNVRTSLSIQPAGRDVEGDFHALTPADPIVLHVEDLLRPIYETAEVQKPVGIIGDAKEPLHPGPGG